MLNSFVIFWIPPQKSDPFYKIFVKFFVWHHNRFTLGENFIVSANKITKNIKRNIEREIPSQPNIISPNPFFHERKLPLNWNIWAFYSKWILETKMIVPKTRSIEWIRRKKGNKQKQQLLKLCCSKYQICLCHSKPNQVDLNKDILPEPQFYSWSQVKVVLESNV